MSLAFPSPRLSHLSCCCFLTRLIDSRSHRNFHTTSRLGNARQSLLSHVCRFCAILLYVLVLSCTLHKRTSFSCKFRINYHIHQLHRWSSIEEAISFTLIPSGTNRHNDIVTAIKRIILSDRLPKPSVLLSRAINTITLSTLACLAENLAPPHPFHSHRCIQPCFLSTKT